jgi:hypothetical protein
MAIVTDKKPFDYPKQPKEREIIGVDFSRRIPSGVTVINSPATPGVDPPDGYSVTATLSESDSAHEGGYNPSPLTVSLLSVSRKVLSCMVSGGTDKNVYKCTFVVLLSDLQVKEEDVFVRVNEE